MGFSSSESTQRTDPIYYPGQTDLLSQLLQYTMGDTGAQQYQQPAQPQPQQPQQYMPYGYNPPGGYHSGYHPLYNPYPQPTAQPAPQQPAGTPRWIEGVEAMQKPYPGQLTAGMSPEERQALSAISGYQPSSLWKQSQEQLGKTISGQYDPISSPYFKAFRENLGRETEDIVTGVNQQFNLGGMLPSTQRSRVVGDVRTDALGRIAQELGGMYETERGRSLQAIPMAMAMEQQPIDRALQLLEAGALPRELEQAGLDRQKQDYLRTLQAMGIPLQIALQLAMWSPTTGVSGSSSGFGLNILGPGDAGDIAKAFAG